MVHRALDQIRELNPKGTTRDDLSEQVWDTLVERGERTFLDIVDAEVRFWATVIAHNPAIRLGESEALWVGRIVRLANIIRNSADRRREELTFLRDQFSRGILTCHRGGEDNMTMDTPGGSQEVVVRELSRLKDTRFEGGAWLTSIRSAG
jgi:hypothetical protein